MALFQRLFLAAGLSALLAGLALTGLQIPIIYPVIEAAEQYETATGHHHEPGAGAHDHGETGQDSIDAAWAPADGASRLLFSALSNVLVGFGLALVLGGLFHLFGVEGWRHGLLWGLGGFAALHLAPALGLPPKLPGMAAPPLIPGQVWWWGTALATAAGLILLFRSRAGWLRMLGMIFIAMPQIIGAPPVPIVDSAVPAALASRFAAASLVTNAVFWTLLGAACARALDGLAKQDRTTPAPSDFATR